MPMRTQSIKVLQKTEDKVSSRVLIEKERASQFEQARALIAWLQENWDRQSIILPLSPFSPNSLIAHLDHVTRHCFRDEYFTMCGNFKAMGLLPPPPTEPPERAILHSCLVLRHEMDDDNAMARNKWPLDWLVRAGYLVDDKRKHLRQRVPDQIITPRNPPHVIFTIEEVA